MEEKIKDVLDAYTFQTTRVCRGRGAFICDTDQGMKIVKAYHRSPQRLEFEQLVKYTIRDRGYYYVDQLLPNKEGQYLNNNKDGQMYTVRDWFEGRECDVKNAADVLAAVRQLAVLHMLMRRCDLSEDRVEQFSFQDTRQIFLKRRKELRAIYSYIRQKKQWNDFEKLYMQLYGDCMKEADAALSELNQFDFDGLRKKALDERTLCHGDFNYHQVILNRKYTAVVNFDKMHYDIQVKDLYQFLRKVLEKITGTVPGNNDHGYVSVCQNTVGGGKTCTVCDVDFSGNSGKYQIVITIHEKAGFPASIMTSFVVLRKRRDRGRIF